MEKEQTQKLTAACCVIFFYLDHLILYESSNEREMSMNHKKNLQKFNWIVFGLLIIISLFVISEAFEELKQLAESDQADSAQSRRAFRWDSAHTTFGLVLLFFTVLLTIGWKRLFPFNVPIAIILYGFYYELFFMTYTVGWVGLIGTLGLAICGVTGILLIISYALYLFFR
ncbi:RND transporter [Bacillus salacetis]|uniref:RND transporter n=1 Tax=Bacillus salacetis TaxID=2315464 RepID=UPI003BA2B219